MASPEANISRFPHASYRMKLLFLRKEVRSELCVAYAMLLPKTICWENILFILAFSMPDQYVTQERPLGSIWLPSVLAPSLCVSLYFMHRNGAGGHRIGEMAIVQELKA